MKNIAGLRKLLVSISLVALTSSAWAQWPQRNITMVVPLAAGGGTDILARMIAEKLGPELGQSVIVENRPGAGSNIGSAYVAKAASDGYTLLMGTSTLATNVSLYKDMGFNLKNDLIAVSEVARIPNVLMVNKQVTAKNLHQFVEQVAANKTVINYGSAGNGTSSHLSGALFNSMAKGDMAHIPYKGGAPANADLIGGQIQAVFSPLVEVLPFIESGKLVPLGVTTKSRSARIPDVPAIDEVLPGFEIALWYGVFAPAGTPADVVNRLSTSIGKILQNPSIRKVMSEQGATPVGSTPQAFQASVSSEIDKWAQLVKLSGARID